MKLSFMVLAAGALVAASLSGVTAANADTAKVSHITTVGVHNTYDPAAYDYLARALDNGSSLIELDVWPDVFTHEWKVSHSNPLGNANNCVAASSTADLYTGGKNKNLEYCLDDIRIWLAAHPGHAPLTLKLEMKTGFSDNGGLGPDELDATFRAHLGGAVYKPAALLGGYATLDAASKGDNWASVDSLRGKVITEIIPGTVEEQNPTDTLKTDVEYARYLVAQKNAGKLADVQIFPTVHGAVGGDPRDKYTADLKPWFVVFDGDANAWVTQTGPGWYDSNHYYVVMTDGQNVAPAIDAHNPTADQANQRVADLAKQHASVITSDWTGLTTVLPQVLARG
ncbi:phosphatidylinositol-specific phospholipase C domain-containing protein [Amycolatopsis sp. H20-H5]|uniref:phosphatidylinositol-specific phospholipase C domain-containing protein n=1 Tax=Amycolatopsis sp. H20-H5 TaxID=3046309 RepID=UPI002DBB85D7|nr:phosphatidylinositol-specific phospholipase C domain-containing protein [Amycolatopsis sp. H20-H5]MEC3981510.1 phosphatidylinositol-specific phospholipase C domain-containing protein [Amycolatopsis sp. H20-H5]